MPKSDNRGWPWKQIGVWFGKQFVIDQHRSKGYGKMSGLDAPKSEQNDIFELSPGVGEEAINKQRLDTSWLTKKNLTKSQRENEKTKIIVHFCGKRALFQDNLPEALNLMQETQTDTLLFNYQGSGIRFGEVSAPTAFQDMVENGIDVVNWLQQKKGYALENIFLVGHSTGGTVAAAVAAHFADKENTSLAGCFIDRGFASFQDIAYDYASQRGWLRPFADSIRSWVKWLCDKTGWNPDITQYMKVLNEKKIPVDWINVEGDEIVGRGGVAQKIPEESGHLFNFDQTSFDAKFPSPPGFAHHDAGLFFLKDQKTQETGLDHLINFAKQALRLQ